MLHCSSLSFPRIFSCVSAHQDDRTKWENLTHAEKLNCAADFGAKKILLNLEADDLLCQQRFPLEAICAWAGKEKMTLDTGHHIRYHAHAQFAREEFDAANILHPVQFDLVDWQMVHHTLSAVPHMFQVWACKQVWSLAPTNKELSRWTTQCPLCPSCMQVKETCGQVLYCTHAGQVEALHATINLLDQWMRGQRTESELQECVYEYATGRGGKTMAEICVENKGMARAQDMISWR